MASLHKFLFGYLPDYFSVNDTNKDTQGKGFLQRYMSAMEEDLEMIKGVATSLLDLKNPMLTPSDTLKYISDMMANPPGTKEEDEIRALLTNIWFLNRKKGTEEGIIQYFRLLGINCVIHKTANFNYKYDDGHLHDNNIKYDNDCNTCTYTFTAILTWLDGTSTDPVDDLGEETINDIMEHLFPVNSLWSVNT